MQSSSFAANVTTTRVVVEKVIALTDFPKNKPGWDIQLDLGGIRENQVFDLTVKIENKLGASIAFDGFRSNCRCTVLSKAISALSHGETGDLKLELRPQTAGNSPMKSVVFLLHNGEQMRNILRVTCSYHIDGFLAFTQPQRRLEFRDDGKRSPDPIVLPFVFSEPVKSENIEIACSSALKNAHLRLVEDDDAWAVVVDIPRESITKVGLFANVILSDREVGSRDECQVTITRVGDIIFSPSKIVMSKRSDSEIYVGSGILRFSESSDNQNQGSERLRVTAESKVGVSASSRKLDEIGKVHRVEFTVNVDDVEEADRDKLDAKVRLRIVSDKQQFFHDCELVFLN